MENDPIREIMAAFVAGCIDGENFIQFKEYLNAGGELPPNELGELQNIVSMIPIILDLEAPDPFIKDNIAKKLIGMQDEIKTKIREERRKTALTFTRSEVPPAPSIQESLTQEWARKSSPIDETHKTFESPEIPKLNFSSTEKVKTATRTGERMNAITPTEPQTLFPQTQRITMPEPQEKYSSGIAGWIAIILVILLTTILGYYGYTSIQELNYEVEELKQNVTSLKSELTAANNFIGNYNSLIEFFNYKDLSVTTLRPTDVNDKASARLIFAFDQKEGLVQFKNARALQPNQGFQIWVVSKNQSYSLGVYMPTGTEYVRLSTFPFVPKEQIDLIRVTIESNTGSPTPSVQNYMTGILGK